MLTGLQRVRVRETAALALYAAGPALVGHAVFVCVVVGLVKARLLGLADGVAAVGAVASLVAFVVLFVASLRELHAGVRAPWLRSILAFGVVFALSGLFFGAVRPPGHYGLHPTLRPPGATNTHWVFSFGSRVF